PAFMQRSSRLLGGASKPVWRSALLPLEAPDRISLPRSSKTHFNPAMAKRRRIARPTTPPPITAMSNLCSIAFCYHKSNWAAHTFPLPDLSGGGHTEVLHIFSRRFFRGTAQTLHS